jgi:hypothetical protein
MKKNLILSMIITVGFGLSVSCNKTTNTPTPAPTTVTPVFTADLGGTAWSATSIAGSVYSSSYITVVGTAADGSKLKITFPIDIKAGTYTIGATSQSSLSYSVSSGAYTANTGGNLVITSNADNVIKGSWNGADLEYYVSTTATIYGTSGNFVAKYQ